VTITYPNGVAIEALVLSHEEEEIRAVAPGSDDVLAFTRIDGIWISEEIEPVSIKFAWECRVTPPTCSEAERICPHELAARVIHALILGGEGAAGYDIPYGFQPRGSRAAMGGTEPLPLQVLHKTRPVD